MKKLNDLRFNLEDHLPSIFDRKFRIDPSKKPIKRDFTTKSFFLTMLYLVGDAGASSYALSLLKSFTTFHKRSLPTKAALTSLRSQVSYQFFQSAFERLTTLFRFNRRLWKDLQVVAIDGMQLTLPRSKDLVKRGFSGRKTSQYSESYMPKGRMLPLNY